jgi:hypothetical protein
MSNVLILFELELVFIDTFTQRLFSKDLVDRCFPSANTRIMIIDFQSLNHLSIKSMVVCYINFEMMHLCYLEMIMMLRDELVVVIRVMHSVDMMLSEEFC